MRVILQLVFSSK